MLIIGRGYMKNYKWLVIIFVIVFSIIFPGCNSTNSQEALAQLEKKIAFYENENEQLRNQLKELEKKKEVYQLKFHEAEHIDIPRTMYVQGATQIRVFPYKNSEVINSISNRYVIVHTKVINDNREEWALVEFTGFDDINNYGYVRVDKLVRKPYKPRFKCDVESISGVAIGDPVAKATAQFGNDYTRYKAELGWTYSFKDDIYVGVDPISNTVKRIGVRTEGYATEEGIQVGDSAREAIELYKSKYKMNIDEHLLNEYPESIFDLGDGYYLQIDFDTEKITDDSIITQIQLFSIHDGDY